jgi:hypothetical protein
MIKLSEDIRILAACYQRLAERSINPWFREGFARLAARYDTIAARREAAERDQSSTLTHAPFSRDRPPV